MRLMRSPQSTLRMIISLVLLALGGLTTGCATAPSKHTTMRIEPGSYAATFDAVKDVLRSFGFELDRIDARAGVITTRPHFSAGLATPWVSDESTFEQEFEGLLNRQRRTVRVDFAPVESEGSEPADVRTLAVPIRARVAVTLERMHRSGLQASANSVRLSSVMVRIDEDGAEPLPWTLTKVGEDDLLASRIVERVTNRVAQR